MEAAKYLEVIGCDVHKPSIFQVNYKLIHHGKRYDFINGLVLSNWTVYDPSQDTEIFGKPVEVETGINELFDKVTSDISNNNNVIISGFTSAGFGISLRSTTS